MKHFEPNDVEYFRKILSEPGPRRPDDISNKTNAEHVQHCIEQVIRIARMFGNDRFKDENDRRRRAFQLPFNLGRLQEIFHGVGGTDRWWNIMSLLWIDKEYDQLESIMHQYADEFGVNLDPVNFS